MIFDIIFIIILLLTIGRRSKHHTLENAFAGIRLILAFLLSGLFYGQLANAFEELFSISRRNSNYLSYIVIFVIVYLIISMTFRNLFFKITENLSYSIKWSLDFLFSALKGTVYYLMILSFFITISLVDSFPELSNMEDSMVEPKTYPLLPILLTGKGEDLMYEAKDDYWNSDMYSGVKEFLVGRFEEVEGVKKTARKIEENEKRKAEDLDRLLGR